MSKSTYTVCALSGLIFCLILAGCANQIPPASEFKIPAVGTLIPGQHEEAIQPTGLPAGQGGVLMINQIGSEVQVAVSSTITAIPNGSIFYFVLPAATYDFYIYTPDKKPWSHTETVADGKLRYVYLSPQIPVK